MALDPLHQFEIQKITTLSFGGYSIDFTNHSLWMLTAITAVILIFALGIRKKALVPGRLQAFVEITFEFIENLVEGTAGRKALQFMPLILTVFLFISSLNLIGMVPHAFTATSQIFTTGALAFSVFALVILVGIWQHGVKFFGLFFPHGTPIYLAPLIIPLELISFFARPFTLTIRLCANMVAGHVLLKIFATFVIMLGATAYAAVEFAPGLNVVAAAVAGSVPLLVVFAITALEVFVALLQAYIFTVLTCVYLNDALNLH